MSSSVIRILALETATRHGSVALLAGERVEEREVDLRGEGVVAAVESLLSDVGVRPDELAAVAVSCGPGSFTGVRIGVSAAQGLAVGLGIPVVPVGTLEALAAAAGEHAEAVPGTLLLPSVDARRGEVYAALYRVGGPVRDPQLVWGPEPVSCAVLVEKLAGLMPTDQAVQKGILCGDGAVLLTPLFPELSGWLAPRSLGSPRAAAVARVASRRLAEGGAVHPEELEPVYLRKSDAEIARRRRLQAG
jgi:tRNA threonylcarbamoyladenosine biosynthesis protein TsaB